MEKRLLFDAFESIYESKLSLQKNSRDTFKEALKEYRNHFGFDPYASVDSFMASRSRHRKKERK